MSELKTNEASEKKVYYIPCEMTREDAAFMGIDPKLVRPLYIDGRMTWGILVPTEDTELANVFNRVSWAETKRNQRAMRCLVYKKEYARYVKCQGDCNICNRENAGITASIDELEENALELTDETTAEDTFMGSEFLKALKRYVEEMPEEDQTIARAILYQIPDKIVMKLLGIEKQSTYSYQKMKVRKKLQAAMEEWL